MSIEPRSLLFVPGSRPERFDKAAQTAADLICIDLEDAVAPADKSDARTAVVEYLAGADARTGVRINAPATAYGVADVNEFLMQDVSPGFVMIPKVEHEETVQLAAGWFGDAVHVIPIIETARGLYHANAICAHPSVQCVVFGGVDYAADVGCTLDWEGLRHPRAALLNAATANRVTLLDVPFTDVGNLDALAEDTRLTKSLGMRARAAIHPTQVNIIHQVFAPTEEEVAHAQAVVEAFDAAEGRAALYQGKLIELPVITAARRILSQTLS